MTKEATQREIGDILGLSTRQISNLEAAGMPHRAEGRHKLYPIPEAVTWYRRREVDAAVAKVRPTDYDEAKTREMAARAELAEIEVAKQRGELVHVDDLEKLHADPLAQIRAQMLSLPGRIAAELPMSTVEAVEIIERVVHEVMAEVSEGEDDAEMDDAA